MPKNACRDQKYFKNPWVIVKVYQHLYIQLSFKKYKRYKTTFPAEQTLRTPSPEGSSGEPLMKQSQMGWKPVDKGVAALDLIPFATKQSQYTPQNQEESRKLGYWKRISQKNFRLGVQRWAKWS